jgi:hypothetical protein
MTSSNASHIKCASIWAPSRPVWLPAPWRRRWPTASRSSCGPYSVCCCTPRSRRCRSRICPARSGTCVSSVPCSPAASSSSRSSSLPCCRSSLRSRTFTHLGGGDTRRALAVTPINLLVQFGLLPVLLRIFMGRTFAEILAVDRFGSRVHHPDRHPPGGCLPDRTYGRATSVWRRGRRRPWH